MRRSMNGTRSAASNGGSVAGKQSGNSITRRATANDENHAQGEKLGSVRDDENSLGMAGPVTARLKSLEKKYAQVLEMQAKFNILDKWIQQQFGLKMFPPPVVNAEKFSEGNPEDVDNPFYAVYLVIQRVKFLEEKVKKLEARPFDEYGEPKPTSNYSSANAFRNFKGNKGTTGTSAGGSVKRSYVSSSPTTPKKAKMVSRPVAPSANYPFKPSVKILPKDPNIQSPVKKEKEAEAPKDVSSPVKPIEDLNAAGKSDTKKDSRDKEKISESKGTETVIVVTTTTVEEKGTEKNDEKIEEVVCEKMEVDEETTEEKEDDGTPPEVIPAKPDEPKDVEESTQPISQEVTITETPVETPAADIVKEEVLDEIDAPETSDNQVTAEEPIPVLEDATAETEEMGVEDIGEESGQEEGEMDVEQKPAIPLDDELGGDVSGSEASVSSLASSSSKPRLSTRRRQAAVPASASTSSTTEKSTEEEKPVMYTARGRRHTVPRRYAEFTGHDNVVSILKSQQRAEKTAAAAGSSKSTRRQPATPTKSQDTPPKIKKMVKSTKTPSPKKLPILTDSDGEGEPGPSKKKPGPNAVSGERPPCVDALVERVMSREVDSDGMVILAESYPNIYVNQQQLITVIVRSNGKSTRLTRKMTTLVFEDSVLASASPFGTKYYKDRLPPEPLEAMVDFIADSGFEPHYSKKKIYMIVGQVCNEARAGRVSRKFMQPLEATPGSSQSSQEAPSSVPTSPTPESPPQ